MAEENPQPATTPPAMSPATPVAGTNTPPPEVVVEELQEKKVKKAFLDKFKLVKKPAAAAGGAGPVTATTKATTPEQAALQIYQQLAEIKGNDYFVWRLKKKSLLVVGGVLLALMWLVILSKWGVESYLPKYAFWNPTLRHKISQTAVTGTPTPIASPSARLKIRVRNNSKTVGAAQALADLLKNKGFTQTEVVDDHQSDYKGISLITKPGATESRALITAVLAGSYPLSSPSAELTSDSDFDAVILFAPEVKVAKPTPKKPVPTATPKVATPSATPRNATSSATITP